MKLKQWLAVVGAMGAVAGASGCAAKPTDGPTLSDAGLVTKTGVERYLGEGGPVDSFNVKVVKSICELEEKNKDKIDADTRLCPTGNPEQVHKPTYPPQ
jgi:hypothetical protein